MKNKILTFLIGVLVGAIIATAGFLVYQKINTNDTPGEMRQSMEGEGGDAPQDMPEGEQGGNGETPPDKPDGEDEDTSTSNNV